MPGPTPVLSQAAEDLALEWTFGNALNFAWYVRDVDWSGTYTGKIYDRAGGRLLLSFPVSATFDAVSTPPRTLFEITAVDADAVRSNGWWHMDETGLDLTRFSGPVLVKA